MRRTKNSSSSRPSEERLISVPLDQVHPHPLNPNLMPDEFIEKLAANIAAQGRYPPLIVRPHPDLPGEFQELDGEQRGKALRLLGHPRALCYLWPCDDATAMTLLATLNRLHGEDVPARRASLLAELNEMMPTEVLATLLPEDESTIKQLLGLLSFDTETLLNELTTSIDRHRERGPTLLSFAVPPEDAPIIGRAIADVAATLDGPNRRGRALAIICRDHLRGSHA